MTEEEFFDKENGTRNALLGPAMSDTDRNIMRDLAGEADEPCVFCNEPVRPSANPYGKSYWEFTADIDGEQPCHEECFDDAKEAAEEAHAEDRAEARDADREADFNMRWPR